VRRRPAEIKEAGVTPTEIVTRLEIGRVSVYRVLAAQAGDDRQEAA
jgi:hypothetical protein